MVPSSNPRPTREDQAAGRQDAPPSLAEGPLAVPADRRVLFHMVQEVRPRDLLALRFSYSLVPHPEMERNRKAGVLTACFLDAAMGVISPGHKSFRQSDRYGHFTYVGVESDNVAGEVDLRITVPPGATRAVLRLLPFANPSIRVAQVTAEVAPLG
ncbi:hypothetical protein [Falsiroseomonas sp. CW058]|uniref:hypothetical protein n=1 Tax=Falsiroseomonas sp. CW058 TaxID=3388664 RepID=UPI003D320B80